jgi:hypothetical protein
LDADRRVWHLAEAANGPDEDIAAELVQSAEHAQARGGLAAAAAFLERATLLTLDADRKAERALAAAGTKFQAGAFDAATALLATAEAGPLNELQQARVDLVRAQLAFATSRGGEAPLLLLRAARRFQPIDPSFARETYLDAISAAAFAGRLATPGGHVLEVARAAASAPRPAHPPRATDLLLDGLAANFVDGYPAGVPDLRAALAAFGSGMSLDEEVRWMWLINLAALHLWDDENWDALSARYLQLARKAGAVNELPLALSTRAVMLMFVGDLTTASALVDEQHTVTEATGIGLAPYAGMRLAARRRDFGSGRRVDESCAPQRPGQLLGGYGGREASALPPGVPGHPVSGRGELGRCRADRGSGIQRDGRDGGRNNSLDHRDDGSQRHRLGAWGRGALARVIGRRRRCRAPL